MRLVILESPYAANAMGTVADNIAYAKQAARDCLERGESPIASHLLFTQDGILDDAVPRERALGISADVAWYQVAHAAVFYLDRGWSRGMIAAHAHGKSIVPSVEYRYLDPGMDQITRQIKTPGPYFDWTHQAGCAPAYEAQCDMPDGRLTVHRHRRPPTAQAPFLAAFKAHPIAFYATMDGARRAIELWYLARPHPSAGPGLAL